MSININKYSRFCLNLSPCSLHRILNCALNYFRKSMRKFLLLSFAIFTVQFAFSQDFSNKGKDFYLCFPNHVPSGNSLAKLSIWITSDHASSGTITMANGAFSSTFNIAANGLAEIDVPFSAAFITNGESSNGTTIQILHKSIRVKVNAGQPAVVAYVQQYGNARSAASLLLPINVLGKKYYVSSFTQNGGGNATVNGNTYIPKSQFQIIATRDNTVVTITPRKNGVLGTPFTVTFPLAGDMIQYQSTDAAAASQDLTGTYIESVASGSGGCLPIAVFSGTSNTTFGRQTPLCNGASYDPLFQQLYPVSTWGKSFGFIPFANYPSGVPYRVMASEDNTNVYFNGIFAATINAGQIYPAAFTTNPATLTAATNITADKPICVMEYAQSSGCAGNIGVGNNQGDPDMVILNPIEQNIRDITIFSTKQQVINTQWVNILIPTAGISSFKISRNGGALAAPTGTWQTFTSLPGYSYLQQQLPVPGVGPNPLSDSYRLVSDSGFNAIAYGLGDNESYAYSAGTNVKDLYQQISVSTQYGIESSPSVCTGTPFRFKISLPYKPIQLNWDLSGLPAGTLPDHNNVTQNPTPTCTTFPIPGDELTYVCPDSIRTVNGKDIYWYSLPAYYMIPAIGTYPITILAETNGSDGCGSEQEINFDLEVSDPPIADFTYTTPGCVAEPVQFSDNTTTVKPNYHWYWDFNDPASGAANYSNLQNPVHTFVTAGPHIVRFASITTPGCLSDTLEKTINVPAMPTATISGTTIVCQNAAGPTVTFTGTGGTPPYTYTYHINAGAPVNTPTPSVSIPTATPGVYTVYLDNIKNTSSTLCTTAITGQSATVTVNPLPSATISGTIAVCQNSTAPNITFTGSGGTAPYTFIYTLNSVAQTISSIGTLSSVTVAAPTTAVGPYTYTLTGVTDASATICSNTASGSATVTVNPLPTATVSGTTELCLNATAPDITFTGSGGTAPYTFTYNINSGGNQTVTTVSGNSVTVSVPTTTAGTYNYNLVSVKESGPTACIQNQTGIATVIVDPKPTASFTTTAPYCESRDITFTPAFGVSSGSVVSWVWDYGDGTGIHIRPDGNPFVVNYATAGSKIVTFKTISDKTCESAVYTQTVTVNPKPQAGFISPEVCLLDPFAQFTDTSKVAAPSTITGWQWDFNDATYSTPGNPNTSTAQNPTHIYTHIGTYQVSLTVTTNSGCTDVITQPVIISDGNPQANFIVQNQVSLCSNVDVSIQNKSSIGSGQITKLEVYWDFVNQPTVFDLDNVPVFDEIYTHTYPLLSTTQNYTVKMRSYSGNLCFSEKTVVITVHASPVVQLNAIPDVCLNNGTVQFTQGSETGSVAGGPGVYSGAGISPAGLFNPITAGVGTHTITYTFTSDFGCVDFKTTDVKVLAAPVAIFAPGATTCQNAVTTFTQSSTSTEGPIAQWIWHWGDGSADETYTDGGPRTHTYSITGSVTATLTVVTAYGCKSLPKSITFTVNPQPLPNFTFTNVACLPQAKIDFVNTTPNISDWAYQWSFDLPSTAPGDQSTQVSPNHTYTSLGSHPVQLIATSGTTGCTNSITKDIQNALHAAPFASFDFNKTSICTDQTVTVTDHSTFADGTATNWAWNYGDNTNGTGQVQLPHTYVLDGTYQVTLNITNSFGCKDDTTRAFTVYPYPTVNAGPDQFILEGGQGVLQGSATGNDLTYQWTPGNYLSSTIILQPVVIHPLADITYTLTVTARGGCAKPDHVFVKVLKFPEIPNTFTPNNDGVHDTWEIKYLYTYPDNRVQVFTRTGELIFESRGYTKPWDGTKAGKPLPFDTYYYIIEPGSGRTPITGYVTIVK